jgi:type IV/VI secretion system ImpK/VasF family protein
MDEGRSVMTRVRAGISTLTGSVFTPDSDGTRENGAPNVLETTLPTETKVPGLIGRLFGGKSAAPAKSDQASTLEFQPKASITLFGDTPQNRDLADRADAMRGATEELQLIDLRLTEQPTEPTTTPRRTPLWDRLRFWRRKPAAGAPGADSAPTVMEGNPTFLYTKFRAFYNEIIRFRHQKTEFAAGFSTAIMSNTQSETSADPRSAAEAQSRKLIELLELQAAEAKWMGGESNARYPDAQYAMAALADEVFSLTEWEGKDAWGEHSLEWQLYRTRGAEFEVFKRIDRLLKDAPNTPVSRDLARVYLLVLAAGFQGKYRPFGLMRPLAEYRQRLYEYVHRGDALMLYAADRKLFPAATARTLQGHAVSRFTAAQRWTAILATVLVGYLVISHVAWSRVASDLSDVTSRIVTDAAPGGQR